MFKIDIYINILNFNELFNIQFLSTKNINNTKKNIFHV